MVENSNLDRYSARLNMTHKMGSRVEVGGNMMFTQISQEMNEERGSNINPFLCVAVSATPSMPVRDASGNYVGSYIGTNVNPLRDIRTDYNRSRMTRMFSTGYASVDIIKGLKLKETLSYDYTVQKDSRYLNPLSGQVPRAEVMLRPQRDLPNMVSYCRLLHSTIPTHLPLNITLTFWLPMNWKAIRVIKLWERRLNSPRMCCLSRIMPLC